MIYKVVSSTFRRGEFSPRKTFSAISCKDFPKDLLPEYSAPMFRGLKNANRRSSERDAQSAASAAADSSAIEKLLSGDVKTRKNFYSKYCWYHDRTKISNRQAAETKLKQAEGNGTPPAAEFWRCSARPLVDWSDVAISFCVTCGWNEEVYFGVSVPDPRFAIIAPVRLIKCMEMPYNTASIGGSSCKSVAAVMH